MQDELWMARALHCAKRAETEGEVPIGAVIVKDNHLLAAGWNQSITTHDATAHAEIQAIRKAGHILGNYRLVDCELYVTLEPCMMCVGAMVHARLKRVIFGAYDPKAGCCGSQATLQNSAWLNHRLEITGGVLQVQCGQLLSKFFKRRRGKS